MVKRKKIIALFLIAVSLHPIILLGSGIAKQVVQEEKTEITQKEEGEDKIISGPQNIKESTGIFVFVAWMWLAIFVLIYVLRLKIKEVDRLLEIRYLSEKKK